MSENTNPWPLWAEQATKGDLIRAIVFMRSVLSEVSAAVFAAKSGDDPSFREHMTKYFEENKELDRILTEIGGGKADG